ncbi:adenylate/guanylate cyclase domain-containing protein [bacterium]|nr:adenylate/guanylate cyclase domain-containing protein [bacterium]
MQDFLRRRLTELLYIPFLGYFASRACKFCFSIGYIEVTLKILLTWLLFCPLILITERVPHRARAISYLVVWGLIGLTIGYAHMAQYSFPTSSLSGIFITSLTGGLVLFLFQHARDLRVEIVSRLHSRAVEGSFFTFPTSIIRRIVDSVIVVNSCAAILIGYGFIGYIVDTPNAPRAFQERALRTLLTENFFIYALHSLAAVLIAIELRRLFQVALDTSSKSMIDIAEGDLNRRLPDVGENEIGRLVRALNRLADRLLERENFKRIFGKYMSEKVAATILSRGNAGLGGEVKHVALFMSDVKGFSEVAEKIPPADLVQILNHDFEKIVGHIETEQGIIDKFIGDACFAYFDLLSCPKSATAALKVAQRLSLQNDLKCEIGIGLHFGEVIAGNIGSSKRLEYTLIGDAVNTLARVESQTRVFKRKVILTEQFRQQLVAEGGVVPPLEDLGLVHLKGKTREVQLWAL